MISMLEGILHRPKTVFVLMLFMVIAGIGSYISIPKEAAPDIDVPFFYVSIGQSGISPEDGARLIGQPMETELRGLEGLKEITTISAEGHVGIILEFDISFDKDKALTDVREKVDTAKAKIPSDADEPSVSAFNMALRPTMTVALSGDVPERALYQLSQRLKDTIEAIPSVREVELSGQRDELLEVIIDTLKMESYNISQSELINALSLNNRLIPAGFLDGGAGRFNIKVPGLLLTEQDVYALPVKQSGEGVVTLGDVATIKRTFKDPTTFTLVNGQPAIALDVIKRIGENVIENNAAVRAVVAEMTKELPSTININYLLDESNNIYEALGSLEASIMTAIFLVMIVVVAALGLRSALLVGLAIPTSFVLGFLTLTVLDMPVNNMIMFGLVLTVGMLVDGAIVMVEYADRKAAEGMEPRAAYIRAAKLMFWPIVSSTATTLAAFLPLLLWPGVSGEFMSYLPITVVVVLSGALLTAMIFLPVTGSILASVFAFTARFGEYVLAGATALAAGLLPSLLLWDSLGPLAFGLALLPAFLAGYLGFKLFRPVLHYSRIRAAQRYEEKINAAKVFSTEGPFQVQLLTGFTRLYATALHFIMHRWWASTLTLMTMFVICLGIAFTFKYNNAGTQFFVDDEPQQAVFYVSARGNMSAVEALELVAKVDDILIAEPGIKNAVTKAFPVGTRSGGRDAPSDLIGSINVELSDYCCRLPAAVIFENVRQKTAQIAGIKVEARKIEGGPPTGKDIQLQVMSNNYDLAVATTARIRSHLDTIDGLRDQEDSRPLPGIEWELTIDREQAARYKADIAAVGAMVQLVTNGVRIGDFRPSDAEDEVDIRVRLPKGERTLDMFDELRLRTPLGLIPLSNFVERSPQQKVSSITRRDGLYSLDIKAGVDQNRFLVNDKTKEIQEWLDSQKWPEDVSFKFRGSNEEQKDSQAFLIKAMIGALFLMFLILLTQYNSFYQSILTLSTVVMSMFGVVLGLLITGQKISIIMTGTGVVALAGIVVNNAIVLIDTYNRFRHDGMGHIDAALKTCAQRIRPVMLTTITTIAGLIPMATQISFDFFNRITTFGSLESVWWVQLATAVISGLAFSTLLTLIIIPVALILPVHLKVFWEWLLQHYEIKKDWNFKTMESPETELSSELDGMTASLKANSPKVAEAAE